VSLKFRLAGQSIVGQSRASSSIHRGVEQPGSSQGSKDTKLKADIAESAVVTALLKKGLNVLKPVGDRLPYDLGIDRFGRLIRIQVKSAWFNASANYYEVDVRRTKTNRRKMRRSCYSKNDFDFAIIYLAEKNVFYVMPVEEFCKYGSTIAFVESEKGQRKPKSVRYRENWDLLSDGLLD